MPLIKMISNCGEVYVNTAHICSIQANEDSDETEICLTGNNDITIETPISDVMENINSQLRT